VYWKVGELASPGIKLMAEEGIPDGLANEVKADISHGHALAVLSSPATTDSPGSNTIASFTATKDFSLVTLVAMFGSTPDWFTGVSRLSLLDDEDWVQEEVIPLYPFDAGTQQNLAFALRQPPEPQRRPIYSLSATEWFTKEPVGSLTFTRIK
jgi:Spondin_N